MDAQRNIDDSDDSDNEMLSSRKQKIAKGADAKTTKEAEAKTTKVAKGAKASTSKNVKERKASTSGSVPSPNTRAKRSGAQVGTTIEAAD